MMGYFKSLSCEEAKIISSNTDSASPQKGKITVNCLVWKIDNTDGIFECILNVTEEQM